MKIQLLSDLHLESHPNFVAAPARGAQLLVLAGDIGAHQPGSRLPGRDFGLTRFSPRHGWPTPVIYLPGNHEYDGDDFDAVHAQLRAECEALGMLWLERETLVLDGIRFIGTTLWSDFDAFVDPASSMTEQFQTRGKAMRAANHYLETTNTLRHGRPFLAEEVREQSLLCQEWLRNALAEPFDGQTVVITHFAPTLASADPRYGLTPGTAGFCNALDALLPLADVWLHGHLHCRFDYVKDGCRVVANPLGYRRNGEQEGFDPQFCVDVG